MWKQLQELFSNRFSYAEQDRATIESIQTESLTLQAIDEMKQTGGWKIIEKKIREELQKTILEKVKDDVRIKTLLEILNTVETKDATENLLNEIKRVIPN